MIRVVIVDDHPALRAGLRAVLDAEPGIVFAGALCIALMTLGAGSRIAWLLLGLAGFLVTASVWPVVEDTGRATKVSFTRYRWTPDALRLVACYAAFGIGYIIPATFVPVMAKAVVHDPAIFGWAWPSSALICPEVKSRIGRSSAS